MKGASCKTHFDLFSYQLVTIKTLDAEETKITQENDIFFTKKNNFGPDKNKIVMSQS